MFKKSDPKSRAADAGAGIRIAGRAAVSRMQEPTPVGPSLHINGYITGNDDLIVHGFIEGKIDIGDGLLMVTKDGRVDADVSARVINVEGEASGELRASEQIIVRRSGRVRGNISAPRIGLDFGCSFSGAIETEGAEVQETTGKDDNVADFKAAISGTGSAKAAAKSSSR